MKSSMSGSGENLHSNPCLAESVFMMDCRESENNAAGRPCDPNPKSARLSPPSPSSPPPKRSRRSVQKRVVSIPIPEAGGGSSRAKGVSECAPPADSWAWRKYGQKPIKGSPYPRGYYRCSSSKGCPARKQVERSSVDPSSLLVTYTCEHNHAWPLPKTHHHRQTSSSNNTPKHETAATVKVDAEAEDLADPDPAPLTPSPQAESGAEPEESRFSDLIGEDSGELLLMPDDFWYSDVGSTSSTSPPSDTLLYGPIFVGSAGLAAADEGEKIGDFKEDDEDALFAGLGELPEYSTVFRRSYFEQQMAFHTAVHQ